MKFKLNNIDQSARRGQISFKRGTIETPAFMPVGTQAVRTDTPDRTDRTRQCLCTSMNWFRA